MGLQLILGGSFQGKRAFALRLSGLTADHFVEDIEEKNVPEPPVFTALHEGIRRILEQGGKPQALILEQIERYPNAIFICDEVGCGIVPLEAEERAYREAVGRCCCLLAQHAERVIRVQCGLARVLKGEPL